MGEWSTDDEERMLELLRLRLGEGSLVDCETMLRDYTDSKRVSKAIMTPPASASAHAATEGGGAVGLGASVDWGAVPEECQGAAIDLLVASHFYWPTLRTLQGHAAATQVAAADNERGGTGSGAGTGKDASLVPCALHPSLWSLYAQAKRGYAYARKPRLLQSLAPSGSSSSGGDPIDQARRREPVSATITLDVQVPGSDESREVTCDALQASTLLFVTDACGNDDGEDGDGEGTGSGSGSGNGHEGLTVSRLASLLSVSVPTAMRSVFFWKWQGVLDIAIPANGDPAATRVHIAAPAHETAAAASCSSSSGAAGGAGDANALLSQAAADDGAGDDPAEAVATWRSFITGMLTNLGPLPLDRIHTTLAMFASFGPHPYDKSPADLTKLLNRMAGEGVIVAEDGTYRLP